MTDEETKAWRGNLPTFTQLVGGRAPKPGAGRRVKRRGSHLLSFCSIGPWGGGSSSWTGTTLLGPVGSSAWLPKRERDPEGEDTKDKDQTDASKRTVGWRRGNGPALTTPHTELGREQLLLLVKGGKGLHCKRGVCEEPTPSSQVRRQGQACSPLPP